MKSFVDKNAPASSRRLTGRILNHLRRAYGPRPWKRWGDGVAVLVETILSQNTCNANSEAGYRQLRRRFRSWKQVADAPVGEVERCIRVSGLSNIKAPRIQAILRRIKADRGRIDLQFLDAWGERQAFDYLRGFAGVGPKTANCVLMFAFAKPVFPVDTHIHRIAGRLGLIGPRATAEQAHDLLTPMIGPGDRYEMHVLLIAHGRATCRAVNPKCDGCVLRRLCAYGRQQLRVIQHTEAVLERQPTTAVGQRPDTPTRPTAITWGLLRRDIGDAHEKPAPPPARVGSLKLPKLSRSDGGAQLALRPRETR